MDEEKNELIEMEAAPEEPPEIPEEVPADAPEEKRPGLNMRTHYLIRILVGGYIAYLGWQLMKNFINGVGNKVVAGIFGVVFLLLGGGLVVWSVLLMCRDDS